MLDIQHFRLRLNRKRYVLWHDMEDDSRQVREYGLGEILYIIDSDMFVRTSDGKAIAKGDLKDQGWCFTEYETNSEFPTYHHSTELAEVQFIKYLLGEL